MPSVNQAQMSELPRDEKPAPPTRPSSSQVCEQLDRILASTEFDVPERAKRFLQYIVDETLAGRPERIKAYSIATEVFERDENFDAQNDPIVRIEAGRLRRALERYYLVAGSKDPVLIDIPKGGYVPTFSTNEMPVDRAEEPVPAADPVSSADMPAIAPRHRSKVAIGLILVLAICLAAIGYWFFGSVSGQPESREADGRTALQGPTLLVVPFADLGGGKDADVFAEGLTEEVTAQLARFREVVVIRRAAGVGSNALGDRASSIADANARYVIEGTIRGVDGRSRITARLVDVESGSILWSEIYDRDLNAADPMTVEKDVAQQIATAVAQPNGILFRSDTSQLAFKQPDELNAYDCTLQFYAYRSDLSEPRHMAVGDCLRRAVAQYPDYATAWALLAYIDIDEYRFDFNPKAEGSPPLQRALEKARRAVRLDPANMRASQALMTALFYDQKLDEALRIGEEALARNPNDTEFLGEYGLRLSQAGFWERGEELIEQAIERNPSSATMYDTGLALSAYMMGDTERAVRLIRKADTPRFPFYYAISALIYANADMKPEAAAARERFMAAWPGFFDDLDGELAKRLYDPGDRAKIVEDSRKAGFPVPLPRAEMPPAD